MSVACGILSATASTSWPCARKYATAAAPVDSSTRTRTMARYGLAAMGKTSSRANTLAAYASAAWRSSGSKRGYSPRIS